MGTVGQTYDAVRDDASSWEPARPAARPRRGAHAAPRVSGWTPARIAAAVLAGLVFLAGLGVVLYPTVSSWVNDRTQSRAVVDYDGEVEGLDPARVEAIFAEAEAYNERLASLAVPSWVNDRTQSRAVVDYDGEVEGLDPARVEAIFAEAEAYNERLASLAVPLVEYEQAEGYEQALDITGTGIMGYVEIPKIDVRLPIYHGTSNDVLVQATGHFEGTTLPIGGSGRHAVIAGHRGLPSAVLFTYLDKLVVGDRFTVTVLDRVMTYEVDQVKETDPTQLEELAIVPGRDYVTLLTLVVGDRFTVTVLDRVMTYEVDQVKETDPTQLEELAIVPGRDYVTLLTCTPYGINTDRLLVRGVRVG